MHAFLFLTLCLPITNPLPDGTLVVLRHSNPLVTRVTQSPWTHIGILFTDDGKQWVYEASPGGVRRMPLSDFVIDSYSRRLCYNKTPSMYTMAPRAPFTPDEVATMHRFANGQLGRRYSLKGIIRDRPVEGTNCAQFVAATLQQSGRFRFANTFTQTPASVLKGLSPRYEKPTRVAAPPEIARQSWSDATERTAADTRRWLKWSTWEALRLWRD